MGNEESASLRVVFVESFWGGSHRSVAQGWASASRHRVRIESLPARFWKWRMRGAAFEFARRLADRLEETDVLFVTSLLDLAHLRALLPRRIPCLLYFHENQAAYPDRPGRPAAERDLQYAFTNLASAAAADRVVFNSAFQRDAFCAAMEEILRRMPDTRPLWVLDRVRTHSEVAHLGVDLSAIPIRKQRGHDSVKRVLWNHRWEHDKDPETFFRVLLRLAGRGVPFRLSAVGESFGRVPAVFEEARRMLGDRIDQWGYLESRLAYGEVLSDADVVVSTAAQENFGLSMVEAACAGAHPLAPRRLSYPEVFPVQLHETCLYEGEADLEERLQALLCGATPQLEPAVLRSLFSRYDWRVRGRRLDELVWQVSESMGM